MGAWLMLSMLLPHARGYLPKTLAGYIWWCYNIDMVILAIDEDAKMLTKSGFAQTLSKISLARGQPP
jgi:hypothetical protein